MKYLVGTMCGGLMEDPEPRFDGPYLIVEASDEETARKLYNKATNASYFTVMLWDMKRTLVGL